MDIDGYDKKIYIEKLSAKFLEENEGLRDSIRTILKRMSASDTDTCHQDNLKLLKIFLSIEYNI